VLPRLAYLSVANVFALLCLLPMSNQDKDAEILALRHQLLVLQRQLGPDRVRFAPADPALLAALLHRLPRDVLKRLHLVVRPDTVLRWHHDMVARRHARRPRHPGRPRTVRSVRALVLGWPARIPGGGTAGYTVSCLSSG
jgi:putative transposase